MSQHEGIVGLAAYYHAGDNRQHIFAARNREYLGELF